MLDAEIGEFSGGAQTPIPETVQPGILLHDHRFAHISDADTVAEIRAMAPNATVIVLSASLVSANCQAAGKALALAFLPETNNPIDVSTSVPALLQRASATPVMQGAHAIDFELTRKQIAVLMQVAQGKSNKEASLRLRMSPETVKSHLSQIYRRLKVANRAEAVNAAHQRGII